MKTQNGKTVNRIGGLQVLLILFFSLRNVKGNATVVEEYGWIFFHAKIQKYQMDFSKLLMLMLLITFS